MGLKLITSEASREGFFKNKKKTDDSEQFFVIWGTVPANREQFNICRVERDAVVQHA